MKEIKIRKDKKYLRRMGIESITIDKEDDITFINGLAVIRVDIKAHTVDFQRDDYQCYGIINEKFEEAFDDEDNSISRYLMFISYNTNIVRCGENDFIVTVRCGDDYHTYSENRHIRLIDGRPTLINKNIGYYILTKNKNIIIANNRLYDVSKGCFISRTYSSIKEAENSSENELIFNIIDKFKADELCEHFIFSINEKDEIISSIFSRLNIALYEVDEKDYDLIKKQRIAELNELEEKEKELISLVYNQNKKN